MPEEGECFMQHTLLMKTTMRQIPAASGYVQAATIRKVVMDDGGEMTPGQVANIILGFSEMVQLLITEIVVSGDDSKSIVIKFERTGKE